VASVDDYRRGILRHKRCAQCDDVKPAATGSADPDESRPVYCADCSRLLGSEDADIDDRYLSDYSDV
jgi:hypothetical protein